MVKLVKKECFSESVDQRISLAKEGNDVFALLVRNDHDVIFRVTSLFTTRVVIKYYSDFLRKSSGVSRIQRISYPECIAYIDMVSGSR